MIWCLESRLHAFVRSFVPRARFGDFDAGKAKGVDWQKVPGTKQLKKKRRKAKKAKADL
jgi:hypothetical protein